MSVGDISFCFHIVKRACEIHNIFHLTVLHFFVEMKMSCGINMCVHVSYTEDFFKYMEMLTIPEVIFHSKFPLL